MDPFRRVSAVITASAIALAAVPALAAPSSSCSAIANPVCASDARTYDNPCLAQKAGAFVVSVGACVSAADAQKVDRAADVFLAKVFFGTRDLEEKVRRFSSTLARFDAVASDVNLAPSTRVALSRIRASFSDRGQRILQAHFRQYCENWFRSNLTSAAPQPGVDASFAPVRYSWGLVRRSGDRLYAVAEVSYENRYDSYSSAFDVSFDKGVVRVLPLVSPGQEISLRKGAVVRVRGSDVALRVEDFIDSPCPSGAFCFWRGQAVETAWYKGGRVNRTTDGGEAFGYRLEIVDTDYKTFAKVKAWPSEWN